MQGSNFAVTVDSTFYFIIGICLVLFLGLTGTMILFIIKYNRKRHPVAVQIKDYPALEIAWIVIPVIIVLSMFVYGYKEYAPMLKPPSNSLKITVIGRQWQWKFVYANGKESKELVIPYKKPILLTLKSMDVMHSLSIPAFRIKEDIIPGKKDNFMWFIPIKKDTFEIFCSAYCGVSHSYMLSKVKVMDEKDYEKWLNTEEPKSVLEMMPGFKVLQDNACLSCHSLDGSKLVGPSYKDLYGSKVEVIKDGKETTVTADDEYIRNKILNPESKTVKGFNKGIMRSYKGVLKDEDIKNLIEYFKAAKGK